ncbi:MAG: iron chelate uptake ABC transporter family permease subunit [Micrococcus sp.]|nr:iron chelate uptake ABC transporter family permease subunit [Micrococcus sp.]
MAETLTLPTTPHSPVRAASASAAPVDRRTTVFAEPATRTRLIVLVVLLVAISFAATVGILTWDNKAVPGSAGFWMIVQLRASSLGVIALVALCHAFATVTFHTLTGNRIITPSIMGFEALYISVQTVAVFTLGAAGVAAVTGVGPFIVQALLMVALATALYSWLLTRPYGSLHVLLLVGVVLGGGLAALSSFMQRLLDPNSFDVLSARLFGNISNASAQLLPVAAPVVLVVCALLWWRGPRLNVMGLGRDIAVGLGVNHRRELLFSLLLVSILMSMTTALVGPMTFLGFLVATLAYAFTDTYDHRVLLPVAALFGYAVLSSAYFVLRHVFYAGGAVTVIIELVGGLVFLIVVLRKGRL